MQYVICYDITHDRRREHLSNALLDYGTRVQESVFVANLDADLAERMLAAIRQTISEEDDRVHVFQLSADDAARTVTFGTAQKTADPEFYIY